MHLFKINNKHKAPLKYIIYINTTVIAPRFINLHSELQILNLIYQEGTQ